MMRTSEGYSPTKLQTQKTMTNSSFQKKRVFYLLLLLFVLGLMYGSILLRESGNSLITKLSTIQQETVANKASQSFFSTICTSVASSGIFIGMTFLLGFGAISQPITFSLLFVKGLGIGSSIGYFYLNNGLAGIGYSALLILPSAVISTFALILSARESVSLSNLLLFSFFREDNSCSKNTLKLYLFKHVILFGFILASALLDGVMTLIFAGIFQFS